MSPRAPVQPQAQAPQDTSQSPAVKSPLHQVPLQRTGIEERLQQLAQGVNPLNASGMMPPSLASPAYTSVQSEDGN